MNLCTPEAFSDSVLTETHPSTYIGKYIAAQVQRGDTLRKHPPAGALEPRIIKSNWPIPVKFTWNVKGTLFFLVHSSKM